MPKLPWNENCQSIPKASVDHERQTGSHIIMEKAGSHLCYYANHSEIKRGTLKKSY